MKLALGALVGAALALPAWGATVKADSCSDEDVQSAIDAAGTGDTVQVPCCSASWDATVTLDTTAVGITSLTLQGCGVGQTQITCTGDIDPCFKTISEDGDDWTVSGFTLIDGDTSTAEQRLIQLTGDVKQFRLHHIEIQSNGGYLIMVETDQSYAYGLVDHVRITGDGAGAFYVDWDNWVGWQRTFSYGGADWWFIEDSTVHWTASVGVANVFLDGQAGARVVSRYNRQVDTKPSGTHGFDSAHEAGHLAQDHYGNETTFTDVFASLSNVARSRSGTGTYHDNSWTVDSGIFLGNGTKIDLKTFRYDNDYLTDFPNGWNYGCNGSDEVKLCSNIDSDWTVTAGGTPFDCTLDSECVTDVGAGTTCKWKFCSDDLTQLCTVDGDCSAGTCSRYLDGPTGGSPASTPCRSQNGRGANMAAAPWYEWNNTTNIGGGDVDFFDSCDVSSCTDDDSVVSGTDFYTNTQQPGHADYTYPHPLQNKQAGTGGMSWP